MEKLYITNENKTLRQKTYEICRWHTNKTCHKNTMMTNRNDLTNILLIGNFSQIPPHKNKMKNVQKTKERKTHTHLFQL